MRRRHLLLALLSTAPASAHAQATHLDVLWPGGDHNPSAAIVALDADDDNDDGVPDMLETPAPDAARDDEVTQLVVSGANAGAVRVHTDGGLRVVTHTGLESDALVPVAADGRANVPIVGAASSAHANDASVTITAPSGSVRVPVTVVAVNMLGGDDGILWPHRDAVRVSHAITNDDTLPRTPAWADRSIDPWNLRAEVWDPGATRIGVVRFESIGTSASIGVRPGLLRGVIGTMTADRPDEQSPLRSRFIRLVGDDTDLRAPGVQGLTMLVGLRDRVRIRYRRPDTAGEATMDIRVGRPGNENGPLAARRARWHLVVMRDRAGGHPVIGGDDASAIVIARDQVTISNEIYLQCMMTFGDPSTYPVAIDDPPEGSLVAVGDDDGLAAAGGEIRLRVNGRNIAPVHSEPEWTPLDTAEALADAMRAAGFAPHVTSNRRVDYGSDGSADVLVRDERGRLARIDAAPGAPLTTDPVQSIAIGHVDLSDGLEEFNNLNSSAGTLEERTMLKSLSDDDPTSIDLFVINRFTHQSRIGEAFVEGDGGAILNMLIVDRAGIAAQREAWTQSHEAGHIFLNQPWHPDNMGPDRPWLLMDADASLGAVTGPKRLEPEECARITAESGVGTVPPLLSRYDEVTPSPRATSFARWPPRELYPRGRAVTVQQATTAPTPHAPDRPAESYGIDLD